MTKTIYPHLLTVQEYPAYHRRAHLVPSWQTFERRPQFAVLRMLSVENNRLVHFKEDLETYCEELGLGRVLWLNVYHVFAENFAELVQAIKERGYYLYDIWGFLPGVENPMTLQSHGHLPPPKGAVTHLRAVLEDRFLGFDNGEQDARYVGGYAQQQLPLSADRRQQYKNFHRHFEKLVGLATDHCSTALQCLSYGHYLAKEGNLLLLGQQTSGVSRNSQVTYAFARGAGKQHGVHWFGNTAMYGLSGFKTYYESQRAPFGPRRGPAKGTSLSLMKRLLYTHYLYNSVILGYEQSWVNEDDVEERLNERPTAMEDNGRQVSLSPVGEIQAAANRFVTEHGQPGAMHTPVALLLDFFAGWDHPRGQSIRPDAYKVWGALPYQEGDYLTHGLLSLLYPGYQDAGFYADERGCLCETPYGDMTDVLLSDVTSPVLGQYGLILLAGVLRPDPELRDKLLCQVEAGAALWLTAANAEWLWPELDWGETLRLPAGSCVEFIDRSETVTEAQAFSVRQCHVAAHMVVARCEGEPVAIRFKRGKGTVVISLTPYGLQAEPLPVVPVNVAEFDDTLSMTGKRTVSVYSENEHPLPCPYGVLEHVRALLDELLVQQQLFTVGDGLGFITCCRGAGDYTLGVYNNGLQSRLLELQSRVGRIQSVEALPVATGERNEDGYWPEPLQDEAAGSVDSEHQVAAGDIQLYRVRVEDKDVHRLAPTQHASPPRDRFLSLHQPVDVKATLLGYPSFFEHFSGVMVDWRYVDIRSSEQMVREADWMARRQLDLIVDFRSGLNFFPDLTLLDATPIYAESWERICACLAKMVAWGASKALIALHVYQREYVAFAAATQGFVEGVRRLSEAADAHGISLYLQPHPRKWLRTPDDVLAFVREVGADNLEMALDLGQLAEAPSACDVEQAALLLLSQPDSDVLGRSFAVQRPLMAGPHPLASIAGAKAALVYAGDYGSWGDIYRDLRCVEVGLKPAFDSDDGK